MATKGESFVMSNAYALSTLGTKPSFSSHLAKYAAISGVSGAGSRDNAVISVSSPAAALGRAGVRFVAAVLLLRFAMLPPFPPHIGCLPQPEINGGKGPAKYNLAVADMRAARV